MAERILVMIAITAPYLLINTIYSFRLNGFIAKCIYTVLFIPSLYVFLLAFFPYIEDIIPGFDSMVSDGERFVFIIEIMAIRFALLIRCVSLGSYKEEGKIRTYFSIQIVTVLISLSIYSLYISAMNGIIQFSALLIYLSVSPFVIMKGKVVPKL